MQRTIVFLPHPEYIKGFWSKQAVLSKVYKIVESLELDYDAEVDLASLRQTLEHKHEMRELFRTKQLLSPIKMQGCMALPLRLRVVVAKRSARSSFRLLSKD